MGVCVVCNVQYKNSVNFHAFVSYDYRMKSHQIHPVALTGTEGISTTLIYNLMSNNTMRDAAKQRQASSRHYLLGFSLATAKTLAALPPPNFKSLRT